MVLIPNGFRDSLIEFNSRNLIIPGSDPKNFGSAGNDVIAGGTLNDVLLGLDGNDRIVGNQGADIIAGDDGRDTLLGGGGRDTLLGGNGNDRVDGGGGNDAVLGGAGNDLLFGRGGNDEFDGGSGNDSIRGGSGFDQAHYAGNLLDENGRFNFDFTLTTTSRGRITDIYGNLGTDLLISIERLKFDDFNVNLNGANNEVIAVDDDVATNEGEAVTFNVLENDLDIDRDFLGLVEGFEIVSIDDSAILGSLTFNAQTGEVTYDSEDAFQSLGRGDQTTEAFTYVVTDNRGATSTATATITITGVNTAPMAVDDVFTFSEGSIDVENLLANDTDADMADILRITSANGFPIDPALSGAVLFTINSTGGREAEIVVAENFGFNLAFNPKENFQDLAAGQTDIVEFTYDISDGNGGTDTATVTIIVEGENDGPVANDDAFTVKEGDFLTVDILANDTDIDNGDILTITGANGNSTGTAFSVTSLGGRQALAIVAPSGALNLAVDQLGNFDDLAAGQIDTLEISYDISDGNDGTDSATAFITIVGEGPETITQSFTANSPNSGQEFTVSLTGDSTSTDGTVDLEVDINFGAVVQPMINVVYVVDTSGSTIASVLAQEVAALQALTGEILALGFPDGAVTISIVPFSTTVAPDATGDNFLTFTLDASDDMATTDQQDINAALSDLTGGGFTNYIAALGQANSIINNLQAANGDATNLVYFLSDGQPTVRDARGVIISQSVEDIAAAAAPLQEIAQISAFEIGNVDALDFLDALDNTGGAQSVTDPNDLNAALLGSPIPSGTVIDADIFVFDDSDVFGTLTNTINIDVPGGIDDPLNPNLIATPFGFELDLTDVTGFASDLGDANRVALVVQVDDDGDGLVDLPILVELDIFGFLMG